MSGDGVDVNQTFIDTTFANDEEHTIPRRAVHAAAEKGHLTVLFLLHTAHATLDARDGMFNTALMLAAEHDHVDCVLFLLEHGCSPLVKVNNFTSFHIFIRKTRSELFFHGWSF